MSEEADNLSESEYVKSLMDDFELTPEDTIGRLIEVLIEDEEDGEGSD